MQLLIIKDNKLPANLLILPPTVKNYIITEKIGDRSLFKTF